MSAEEADPVSDGGMAESEDGLEQPRGGNGSDAAPSRVGEGERREATAAREIEATRREESPPLEAQIPPREQPPPSSPRTEVFLDSVAQIAWLARVMGIREREIEAQEQQEPLTHAQMREMGGLLRRQIEAEQVEAGAGVAVRTTTSPLDNPQPMEVEGAQGSGEPQMEATPRARSREVIAEELAAERTRRRALEAELTQLRAQMAQIPSGGVQPPPTRGMPSATILPVVPVRPPVRPVRVMPRMVPRQL